MSIAQNIARLRSELPSGVVLVAVSKMQPASAIAEAYATGQRLFGESRPQEMAAKQTLLPADIAWHQIGHLQRNKVKLIAPFVSLIHSVDSPRLLETIDTEAERVGRVIDILLEIRIAREETKFGWDKDELCRYLDADAWRALEHVRFRGVMGMATLTPDRQQVHAEFSRLRTIHEQLRRDYFGASFDTLSMGMSGDRSTAIACGSTMIRIGSDLFAMR